MNDVAKLLIVEDEDDIRDILRIAFENEGYAIEEARNGKDALVWLLQLSPDQYPRAILLDLMMPIMNGWAFLEALQQDAMLLNIPVLVLTAVSPVPRREDLPGAPKAVVEKPIPLHDLVVQVQEAVA